MHYSTLLCATFAVVTYASPIASPMPQVQAFEVTDSDTLPPNHESVQHSGMKMEVVEAVYSNAGATGQRPVTAEQETPKPMESADSAKVEPQATKAVPATDPAPKSSTSPAAAPVSRPTTSTTKATPATPQAAQKNTAPVTPPTTLLGTAYKAEKDREAKVYQDWKTVATKYFAPTGNAGAASKP